jgi:hypothetical protein
MFRPFLIVFSTMAIGASVSGCTPDSEPSDAGSDPSLTLCVEPRPQTCTREFVLVCGQPRSGDSKTYANACDACADSSIMGHRPGPCD